MTYMIIAQYQEYSLATNKRLKDMVENRVRLYSHNLKSKLYSILNDGYNSGLFEHGSFDSDLSCSFTYLKQIT